jgi:hypothetical protein
MSNDRQLDDDSTSVLSGHMRAIEQRILERARELAGSQTISAIYVEKAIREFAPGDPYPQNRHWLYLTWTLAGTTLISALLAATFGGLALFGGSHLSPTNQVAFLDIAKVFAGAVVGSTGASVVSGTRSR